MSRKLLIIIMLLVSALALLVTVVYASSYSGTLTIDCTGFIDHTLDTVILDRDNTGKGREIYHYLATDGAGTVLFEDTGRLPLGSYILGDGTFSPAPAFNPITLTLTSLAGNGLSEQQVFSIQGSCAGLPTYGDACVALTPWAVVGDMPFSTQAYYAPGKVSPGVVIDPGTYWVLGEDASGEYYKIVLSCQYLWVPINSMQPSFQAPWSGQSLPTTVVS